MKVTISYISSKDEERAQLFLHEEGNEKEHRRLMQYLEEERYKRISVFCEKDRKKYRLESSLIFYIDTEKEKLRLHTADEIYRMDETLQNIKEYLPREFERISKSVILNLKAVACYKPQLNGLMAAELKNGETVYISRKYLTDIRERIKEVYQ